MRLSWMVICTLVFASLASAQPFYTGAYGFPPHCQSCHSSGQPSTYKYPYWNEAPHAAAYDSHPEVQWDETCLPCHTTGWDLTQANGGFDEFFYAGDTLGMMELRNVQCEVCHGPTDEFPHPETTVVDFHAEVCAGCHNEPDRPLYGDWTLCGHSQWAQVQTQQLECAKCHEAASAAIFLTSGHPASTLPDDPTWQITCVACHTSHDPVVYGAELRKEPEILCRECHTMEEAIVGEEPHSPQREMLLGPGFGGFEWPGYVYENSCHEMYLPEPCVMCHMWPQSYGNPDSMATGHSLQPDILFCATPGCHAQQIPPDSSYNIEGVQTEIDSLTAVLAATLAATDTTLIEYAQAKFDYDFVQNDGSRGVHNYFYARGLLLSSIEGLEGVGITDPGKMASTTPAEFKLQAPCPNPFNPSTTLTFTLPVGGMVKLDIFDVNGRDVGARSPRPYIVGFGESDLRWYPPGTHQITFDGSGLPSGIYLAWLTANVSGSEATPTTEVRKLVLLK